MQAVADAVGVAKSTVSRAFRNHPKCGAELRARILAKAEELGYVPDPLQRVHLAQVRLGLPEGTRGAKIWMLDCLPWRHRIESCPSNGRLVRGARARAESLGLGLEVFRPSDHGFSGTAGLARVMAARGIHGLIVGPMPTAHGHLELDLRQVSAVELSHSLDSPVLHRIGHNHYQATWDALARLHGRGCRRVGVAIQENLLRRVGRRWQAACVAFCEEQPEMTASPVLLLERGVLEPGAEEAEGENVRAWARRQELDAVLTLSPWVMTALARKAATRRVLALDLDWYPDKPGRAHLGVDQNFELLGATAVDEVVAQWGRREYGVPVHAKAVLLRGRLVDVTEESPAAVHASITARSRSVARPA